MAETKESSDEGFLVTRELMDSLASAAASASASSKTGAGNRAEGVSVPQRFEGSREFNVASSTVVTTDAQWNYTVTPVATGSAAWDGSSELPHTFQARNRWEAGNDKAKYVNTNVTGLLPIPVGAPVDGYWGVVDGVPMIIFKERNEPKCS